MAEKSKKIVRNIYDSSGNVIAQQVTTRATGETTTHYISRGGAAPSPAPAERQIYSSVQNKFITESQFKKENPWYKGIGDLPAGAKYITAGGQQEVKQTAGVYQQYPLGVQTIRQQQQQLAGISKPMQVPSTPSISMQYIPDSAYTSKIGEWQLGVGRWMREQAGFLFGRGVEISGQQATAVSEFIEPPFVQEERQKGLFEFWQRPGVLGGIVTEYVQKGEYEEKVEELAKEKGYTLLAPGEVPSAGAETIDIFKEPEFKLLQEQYEAKYEKEIAPIYAAEFKAWGKEFDIKRSETEFIKSFGVAGVGVATGGAFFGVAGGLGRAALAPSKAWTGITAFGGEFISSPSFRAGVYGTMLGAIIVPTPFKIPGPSGRVRVSLAKEFDVTKVGETPFKDFYKQKLGLATEVGYFKDFFKRQKFELADVTYELARKPKHARPFAAEAVISNLKAGKPIKTADVLRFTGRIEKAPKAIWTEGLQIQELKKITYTSGAYKIQRLKAQTAKTGYFRLKTERVYPSIRVEGVKYWRGESMIKPEKGKISEFTFGRVEYPYGKIKAEEFIFKKAKKSKAMKPFTEEIKLKPIEIEPLLKPAKKARVVKPSYELKEVSSSTAELLKATSQERLGQPSAISLRIAQPSALRQVGIGKTKLKLKQQQFLGQIPIEQQKIDVKLGVSQLLGQRQTQQQRQRQALRLTGFQAMMQERAPMIPRVPKIGIPIIIPLGLPTLELEGIRKKAQLKGRRYKYQPSLRAVEFRIFGKQPKYLTGLELRKIPLLATPRKRRKKRR